MNLTLTHDFFADMDGDHAPSTVLLAVIGLQLDEQFEEITTEELAEVCAMNHECVKQAMKYLTDKGALRTIAPNMAA